MQAFNPGSRLYRLFVYRYVVVLACATIAAAVTLVVGLMSPKTYSAEAVLVVESDHASVAKIISPLTNGVDEAEASLTKASLLLTSPAVMEPVVSQLQSDRFDLNFAFPHIYRTMDWRKPLKLMLLRLEAAHVLPVPRATRLALPPQEIQTQILDHLTVTSERTARTLTLHYEAGKPEFAQFIATLIVESFVRETTANDRRELASIEHYLSETIKRLEAQIHDVEGQVYAIMEKFPEMTSAGGKGLYASDFLKKRETLTAIEQELEANNRLIAQWRAIPPEQLAKKAVNQDVKAKVLREIGELQFREIEATEVSGYPQDHASLKAGQERLGALKALLARMDRETMDNRFGAAPPSKDPQDLSDKTAEILLKNRQLEVQRSLLKDELDTRERYLKTGIRKEFELDSLNRQLAAYVKLSTDLAVDLEKVRMQMAGARSSVRIQKSPSLPRTSNNLPLESRVTFGFILGIAGALSLLLLLDFAAPRLLAASDFEDVAIRLLGRFRTTSSEAESAAACLAATLAVAPSAEPPSQPAKVVVFYPTSAHDNAGAWIDLIADALKRQGVRVATLHISDTDAPLPDASAAAMPAGRIPFDLAARIADLAVGQSLVLLYAPVVALTPLALPVNRLADHVVYLSSLGESRLKTLLAVRQCAELRSGVEHHGMIIKPA